MVWNRGGRATRRGVAGGFAGSQYRGRARRRALFDTWTLCGRHRGTCREEQLSPESLDRRAVGTMASARTATAFGASRAGVAKEAGRVRAIVVEKEADDKACGDVRAWSWNVHDADRSVTVTERQYMKR